MANDREEFRKTFKEKFPDVKAGPAVRFSTLALISIPFFLFLHFYLSSTKWRLRRLLELAIFVICGSLCFVILQVGKAGGEKWKSLSDAVRL